MGSYYSGIDFGNDLILQVLEANGVTPEEDHTYKLKDTSNGCKLIEYDKDGELINSYSASIEEPPDMKYVEDTKRSIEKIKKRNKQIEKLRYYVIGMITVLLILAIIVIMVNKS